MATLHRQASWRISVYGREHGVAHFHIEGRGWRCSVAIATLEVIVGDPPASELKAARAWAGERRDELMATWRRLNP